MSRSAKHSQCLRWFLENGWSVEIWKDQYDTYTAIVSREASWHMVSDRRWRRVVPKLWRIVRSEGHLDESPESPD